jgi:hypothetical protein
MTRASLPLEIPPLFEKMAKDAADRIGQSQKKNQLQLLASGLCK